MDLLLKDPDSCHLSFIDHLLWIAAVLTTLGNFVSLIITNFYAAGNTFPILQIKRPQLLETEKLDRDHSMVGLAGLSPHLSDRNPVLHR